MHHIHYVLLPSTLTVFTMQPGKTDYLPRQLFREAESPLLFTSLCFDHYLWMQNGAVTYRMRYIRVVFDIVCVSYFLCSIINRFVKGSY